jgi:hypothetical protein
VTNFLDLRTLGILLTVSALMGCAPQAVRTKPLEPIKAAAASIPAHLFLDVNVAIFEAGIEHLDPNRATTTPGIRRAEGHYAAQRLKGTLEATRQWGSVRVVPKSGREVDVVVSGTLLESDGMKLKVEVNVEDASGKQWFKRTYAEEVNRFAYDVEIRRHQEPFQNVYTRIANDMQDYLTRQDLSVLEGIRATSELRFAQRFAPQAFGDHLQRDSSGHYAVKRLPADDDPLLQRVRRIRVRDQAFVDRMQESYDTFDRNMIQAYDSWRLETLIEKTAESELKSEALARTLGGVLAVVGGILAQTSNNSAVRTAGVIGIGGGAYAVKSGFDKRAEAQIHSAAMRELSESLNADVQPQTIALTDRNVELTGTVEDQYGQWQTLLKEIYLLETEQIETPSPPIADTPTTY